MMRIQAQIADFEYCLPQAAELVEGPPRAVYLAYDVITLLQKHLRFELRRGLVSADAMLTISCGPRGKCVAVGLEQFRLDCGRRPIRLVRVNAPTNRVSALHDFWVVAERDYCELYRTIRRLERHSEPAPAPLMPPADRQRLWDNTIGFLLRGQEVLRRYGVARKRGVLLTGNPGNGKTMACRWLMAHCNRRGLRWSCVTPIDYQNAHNSGEVADLFSLDGPGIILFDDFDAALAPRDEKGPSADRTTFLTQLDGVHPRDGVVFLFTSNARPTELDAAFRRPGRIDLILNFPAPNAELRRELIESTWHADIRAALDVAQVVAATDGLSFAELEEVKKLLVLRFLDHGTWDWPAAWAAFHAERANSRSTKAIGFHLPVVAAMSNGQLTMYNEQEGR